MPHGIIIPRRKTHINLAYDFWAWSCECLEWGGPDPATEKIHSSHHVLPVFMHHFGCVVPSLEALEILKSVARGRQIVDMGSGNGYWTYMLRRHGLDVTAVDNLQSSWRTLWIGDTITINCSTYLKENKGCKDSVLLLVYPIVGGKFTKTAIDGYEGNTIVVAGTQNRNGYTAFRDLKIDEWMGEEKKEYKKTVQVALPSFAGKDEALFVFERGNE